MKKIVRQQNYLKELINSQENKQISRYSLRCMVRAALEPLLDNPENGVVLHRIINTIGLVGLIKRLEFSEIESYNFSDERGNLKEKVWADTEFLCVMTHRYVSILIWDNKADNKNYVRYYSLFNSKLQDEALDIIHRNSLVDVKQFQEKFRPDRRDNILLNVSVRKIAEYLDEASKDAVLGFAEFQSKPAEAPIQVREIGHEIRNQLSICDLYNEVLNKYCVKNGIEDVTITNAIKNISKAIKMASNSLLSLKSSQNKELQECKLKDMVNVVVDLTKVYFECKNIEYKIDNKVNLKIMANEDSLVAVMINLIKNAVEAFGAEEEIEDPKNGKYIRIVTEKRGDFAVIRIINNAGKIENPERVFEKGFTTKSSGSGLGLSICKKSIEEQNGELKLEKSTQKATEFTVKFEIVSN